MNHSFPKSARLRFSRQFSEVDRFGTKRSGKYLSISLLKKYHKKSKMGITASRRFGSSVIRNSFKRRLREAYRLLEASDKKEVWIHVKPRALAQEATMQELQKELLELITS